MTTLHRATAHCSVRSTGTQLGPRQVEAIVSSPHVDLMGDVVVQTGIDASGFMRRPTILFNHDANHPIAHALSFEMRGGNSISVAQFPPEGTSAKSDEIYGLIKAGVVTDTSIGFIVLESEPLDPKQPWAGQRFAKTELLEWSFVSVGANRESAVTGKSFDPAAAERLAHAQALHRGLTQPRRSALSVDATEAEMLANARRLALNHLRDGADLATASGRAQHARRLRKFHGDTAVDPRAAAAEAAYRTAPRW